MQIVKVFETIFIKHMELSNTQIYLRKGQGHELTSSCPCPSFAKHMDLPNTLIYQIQGFTKHMNLSKKWARACTHELIHECMPLPIFH